MWYYCVSIIICNYNHLLQPFNGLFSRTNWVSRYQKGKTNLDFTGARDSEWQWHQLGHMQVCTSLQTDNHASTPPLCFLQAGCPSCRPTNSVKALKALTIPSTVKKLFFVVCLQFISICILWGLVIRMFVNFLVYTTVCTFMGCFNERWHFKLGGVHGEFSLLNPCKTYAIVLRF